MRTAKSNFREWNDRQKTRPCFIKYSQKQQRKRKGERKKGRMEDGRGGGETGWAEKRSSGEGGVRTQEGGVTRIVAGTATGLCPEGGTRKNAGVKKEQEVPKIEEGSENQHGKDEKTFRKPVDKKKD